MEYTGRIGGRALALLLETCAWDKGQAKDRTDALNPRATDIESICNDRPGVFSHFLHPSCVFCACFKSMVIQLVSAPSNSCGKYLDNVYLILCIYLEGIARTRLDTR